MKKNLRGWALGSFVIALLSFLMTSFVQAHDEGLNTLSTQLIQANALYHRAPAAEKSTMLTRLLSLASSRQIKMLEKTTADPAGFLLHALPSEVRNSLPEQVRLLVEQHLEVSGNLTVLRKDDFEHGRSELIYEMSDDASPGSSYTLHFAKNPPDLMTDSKVKAQGVALGSHLVLAAGGGSSLKTVSSGAALVTGDQKTVVLLANFTDATMACTPSSV